MNCCCENMSVRVLLAGLLLLVAATTLFHVHVVRACIPSERLSLLNFKLGVVDPYNVLSDWTQSSHRDCCTWTGIRCDNRTHHVISIDLIYYLLGGLIGPSLVELQYLEHLDLWGNSFTQIPKFIGSFKSLKYLDLGWNPLVGAIPSQLGNLTKLQFLRLGPLIADNLEWLSHLPSLTSFILDSANFTKSGLQSFKMLPSLSTLQLFFCQFPEADTSSLSHANSSNSLQTLYMESNSIHSTTMNWLLNSSRNLVDLSLPYNYVTGAFNTFEWLSDLPSLTTLALGYTNFTEAGLQSFKMPPSLSTLELYGCQFPLVDGISSLFSANSSNSLTSLTLYDNTIHPSVLAWLLNSSINLTKLQTLSLSGNNFNGTLQNLLFGGPLLEDEKKFPSLRELDLSNNLLEGPLPDLSKLSSLTVFDISNNRFNGAFAEIISHLHNDLESLDVSSNHLSGVVSEVHFKKLSNLKSLDLSSNLFTFSFNSNWVPPFQLNSLLLRSCKIGPQFPSWLHNQLNLSVLDISNSGISGAIPNWFSNISLKLEYLDLSSNLIDGTLPYFPLMFEASVNLSFNRIHGPVPLSLSNAMELYLSNNTFSGFRSFLCHTTDGATTILDLSNNHLFGSLPDCWGNLKDLQILKLDNNELFGVIPSSFTLLNRLSYLNLRHNKFSEIFPPLLKNCTNLRVLQAGENNWNGEIPTWIGESLTNLVFLSLKSNGFYGSIPSNLCNLQFLQILDLSNNNISGVIPSCIHNFTSMVQDKEQRDMQIDVVVLESAYMKIYTTTEFVMWKGVEYKYEEILGLLRIIDLSSNRLIGEIPKELENLAELIQLNLSRNNLSGAIPNNIGKFSKLESLDLSHNKLSGKIPVSLATVSTLGYLDLSNNQLSGRIPTGTQLQSFNASAYAGNLELCGEPLMLTCPGDETLKGAQNLDGSNVEDGGEWYDMSWLQKGVGVGFAVGFCGVCGNLLLHTSWRQAYFRFLDDLGDWLYVIIAVKWAAFKRRFSR